jgi:hypothetical protein
MYRDVLILVRKQEKNGVPVYKAKIVKHTPEQITKLNDDVYKAFKGLGLTVEGINRAANDIAKAGAELSKAFHSSNYFKK